MDSGSGEEPPVNFSLAQSSDGAEMIDLFNNKMGPLIEIRNLLTAVCIMAVAMAICAVAAMQTCYCYKLYRRKRCHLKSNGDLFITDKCSGDKANAQEGVIPTAKILARIDEFDLLTPLTPTTVPTGVFTLTGNVVKGPQYSQSPGRITLFPLGCSVRKVNSNRIYCSPDETDYVYSIYNTGLPFTGTKSPHEELDLISMDRTTSTSVREVQEAINGCCKPQPAINGLLNLEQSSSVPTSSTPITSTDDIINGKCIPSVFEQLTTSNDVSPCYKQNGIVHSAPSSNNLSSSSESSICDSGSGLDTTDSLSDNVFGCDDGSAAVTERFSEIRLLSGNSLTSSDALRRSGNHCQFNSAAVLPDCYSVRPPNLDKIVEETESETDNSRIASYGIERNGTMHKGKRVGSQL